MYSYGTKLDKHYVYGILKRLRIQGGYEPRKDHDTSLATGRRVYWTEWNPAAPTQTRQSVRLLLRVTYHNCHIFAFFVITTWICHVRIAKLSYFCHKTVSTYLNLQRVFRSSAVVRKSDHTVARHHLTVFRKSDANPSLAAVNRLQKNKENRAHAQSETETDGFTQPWIFVDKTVVILTALYL